MSDNHHAEISEDRLFFFERQEVAIDDFEASGPILDIGGGGEGIIGRLKGAQVVAIDPNRRELEEAAEGPLKVVMDATDLRFLDGAFDTATSFFTLMYIKGQDHEMVFAEVFRVLAPGGRFLIWDFVVPPRGDEEKDIAVIPLLVRLPDAEVETGYGMLWPDEGYGLSTYAEVAERAGFGVVEQWVEGHVLFLELQKLPGV